MDNAARKSEVEQDLKAGAESLYDDLAMISCRVANELDRLIAGLDVDPDMISRLVQRISTWIPKIEDVGAARSLADSNTVVAMANALPRRAENTQAVAQGAKEMISLLSRIANEPTAQLPDE